LVGGELVAFDIRDQLAIAINNSRMQGVIHQAFVREEVHSEHVGDAAYLDFRTSQEVPSFWISLPGSRVAGQDLRAVALRIEGDGEQHKIAARCCLKPPLKYAKVIWPSDSRMSAKHNWYI
jgi:hypothetical protein